MIKPTGHEITELLQARHGDEQALEKLTPQVYRNFIEPQSAA
jgi:hypothetical protein